MLVKAIHSQSDKIAATVQEVLKVIFVLLIQYTCTCLVEQKSVRTDPRVPGVVLTVVKHFTVQSVIGIVASLFSGAVEFGLRQQQSQAVRLLFLLLQLLPLQQVHQS